MFKITFENAGAGFQNWAVGTNGSLKFTLTGGNTKGPYNQGLDTPLEVLVDDGTTQAEAKLVKHQNEVKLDSKHRSKWELKHTGGLDYKLECWL